LLPRTRSWNAVIPSHKELHEAKRRAALREAAKAFNRNGYHATTLDALAKRLGITKAALYHYFPSKNALLKACFDEVMEAAFSNLARARAQGRNGREKLRMVFTGYLQDIIDELSVTVVVLEDDALTSKDREQAFAKRDRFEHSLRELVSEGISDGSIVPCDPKLVILAMLGAVNWVPRWFRHNGEWSTQQLANAMSEILDRSISSQPSASLAARVEDINVLDAADSGALTGGDQPAPRKAS
jgi:TetR/AcrR family transcriptional regulator